MSRLWLLLLFICGCFLLSPVGSATQSNDRPIIGLLAQDLSSATSERSAYIAASYVKFLESAGARVVPIMINQSLEDYTSLFNSINGVLFPGGAASIWSSGYERAARIFYHLAIEANQRGDYFPIWGTCLGFEQLCVLTSSRTVLSRTQTTGVSLPLNLTCAANGSRLFSGFPEELLKALASEPLTENSHKWSLGLETYEADRELKSFYKVLSTNTDGAIEFVSTFEAYRYPFYGTQWHPEKNAFEWNRPYIAHSPTAVQLTFYTAQFFVDEARKSSHRFANEEEESNKLIYNFSPEYGGPRGTFVQKYFF